MDILLFEKTVEARTVNSISNILGKPISRGVFWNSLPVAYPEDNSPVEDNNGSATKPVEPFVSSHPLPYASQSTTKAAILVVEDNPANQRVLKMQLQYLGFQADIVASGRAAIETLTNKSHGYQIVLMDVQMPGMDGLTATRLIREWERENAKRVRIVGVTAGVTTENRADCIQAGMDDFLTKPLRLETLRELLKSVIH